MTLAFTRRTLNRETGKFTNNFSPSTTRYLKVTTTTGGAKKGHIILYDDWLADVKAQAGSADILIWVHGFNTPQSSMLKRQRKIEDGLRSNGFDGAVVGFDWPSDGIPAAYVPDRRDAAKSAEPMVRDGIMRLRNSLPGHNIHLIAHSMGVYLTLIGLGKVPGSRVDQMVFVAADYDADKMKPNLPAGKVVEKRSARLTNYFSTKDRVLNFATGTIQFGDERLGRVGFPSPGPSNGVNLNCTEVYDTHVTSNGMTLSHRWYFDDERFLTDAALTISGKADSTMPTRKTSAGTRTLKP